MQPNKVNENEMDCGLNEIKWNMISEVWIEGNKIKHEQWSQQCNNAAVFRKKLTRKTKEIIYIFEEGRYQIIQNKL